MAIAKALPLSAVLTTSVLMAQPAKPVIPPAAAAIEQTSAGTRPPARLVASFDGLAGRNPSDNSLAVGREHVMQTVNSRLAVYSKKGELLYGPTPTNSMFHGFGGVCDARNNGDAVVRYDQLAERWLVVMPIFTRVPRETIDGRVRLGTLPRPAPPPPPPPAGRPATPPPTEGSYAICYAVSVTADPLGSYYRYVFERPLFPDYPRPAVWPDGYYVPTSTGDDVVQKHACVVDRRRMLRGENATEQCIVIDGVNFLNNADVDGRRPPRDGAPNIMLAAGGRQLASIFEDDALLVWKFHVDWTVPSRTAVSGPERLPVAPYHYLCDGQLTNCVPQPGTERRLDAQGDKIMQRVVYRNVDGRESIAAVHSVATAAGAGGVRWYELRLGPGGSPSLHQQGTYAPDANFRWMASPGIDRFGNIAIGYSFGGEGHFAGQRFAARLADDPPGMMTLRETVLAEGEAAQTGTIRWQDYTTMTMDPVDDCTFWYVGDYLKRGAEGYSTRIGSFRLPGC